MKKNEENNPSLFPTDVAVMPGLGKSNQIPNSYLVVQHNDLVGARFELSLSENRLILEAMRNIHKDDEDFKEYELDVNVFVGLLDTKNKNEHSRIREFCKTILSKPIEIPKSDGLGFLYCNWFSSLEYNIAERKITCCFDPKLKPFLLKLKQSFTKYDIRVLLKIQSIYALRLYMLLKTELWKGSGSERDFEIPLKDLKQMLKIEDKYEMFGHLKSRVLDIAKTHINESTDFDITINPVKKGKKVERIRFSVKLKNILPAARSSQTFTEWKEEVIQKYKGNALCNCTPLFRPEIIINISESGFLQNSSTLKDLSPDDAKEIWQWLFKNKELVGIVLDPIVSRINTLIGSKIKDNSGTEFTISSIEKSTAFAINDEVRYSVEVKNSETGTGGKLTTTYLLEEIEQLIKEHASI